MSDCHHPDAFEKRLRFGCGFSFGAVIAFFVGLRELEAYTGTFWAVVIGVALIFGFCAMCQGDEFWHGLSKWFPWW
ncbi:MAG: hypothetical protein ACKVY0_27475 [Prosthecobacter sp.]|uniref:hypothetical protein n=1 Tax=Prosthecobacter sp. TaxID=1965333 RepID=UPI003903B783